MPVKQTPMEAPQKVLKTKTVQHSIRPWGLCLYGFKDVFGYSRDGQSSEGLYISKLDVVGVISGQEYIPQAAYCLLWVCACTSVSGAFNNRPTVLTK